MIENDWTCVWWKYWCTFSNTSIYIDINIDKSIKSMNSADYASSRFQWLLKVLQQLYKLGFRLISHEVNMTVRAWKSDTLHYRLRLIESVHYRFLEFASHFICLQIFQIGLSTECLILSVSKYSRYIFRGRNAVPLELGRKRVELNVCERVK